MSGTTLATEARRTIVFVGNLGSPAKSYAKEGDSDKLILERVPIFRSGTFADSRGEVSEWDPLHIHQMVDNFTLLYSRSIFSDVPIRKHHRDWGGIFSGTPRNPMDELMGYMTNLQSAPGVSPADNQQYEYLLADFELIHEEAVKNVKSGLWRNLSAELSTYVTNTNAEYFPTIMGVAYVDIPAVEGLKVELSKAHNNVSLILEDGMSQPIPGVPGATDHAKPPAPPAPPAPPVPPNKKEDEVTTSFSIGGKPTTDHAAVQAHITQLEAKNTGLEQFRTEALESARINYVKMLVKDNKLPASQEEGYVAYAKSLDDAAFEAWKKLQDAAPAMSITSSQGAGFSSSVEQAAGQSGADDRKSILMGVVANHQRAGMPLDAIKKTSSYKELLTLDSAFVL